MATRSRQDLIFRTLKLLGAAGVGQTPSDEDRAAVEDQIDTTLDMLTAKQICDFPSRLEFHSALIQPLALRLACSVGPDLAVSTIVGFGAATLAEVAALAEQEMRYINAEDQTDEPVRFIDY
ncbi:MAG: hypothetical protein ABWY64_21890 [Tardiphaga sp.]